MKDYPGKRIFDLVMAVLMLLFWWPFILIIVLLILISSGAPVFYRQERIGKNGIPFRIFKFRTMKKNADQLGLLTIGGHDPRITGIGFFLRKFKLDELPQLFNVISGKMSIVGPRPEVAKYVSLYSESQKHILNVRPGITDPASLTYRNENEILARFDNPEEAYIREIMPAKIELNRQNLLQQTAWTDFGIIVRTATRIFS